MRTQASMLHVVSSVKRHFPIYGHSLQTQTNRIETKREFGTYRICSDDPEHPRCLTRAFAAMYHTQRREIDYGSEALDNIKHVCLKQVKTL